MIPWDDLTAQSLLTCPVGGWKPTSIASAIEGILAQGSREVERRRLGESFEGRPIELLVVGDGDKRAMMWSQMHGDEPTHTSVLLNLLRLLKNDSPLVDRLLRGLTIGMILPLNPDGAHRNTRHNAQGVDINRDALEFASPEGRAFRKALEEFKPDYGFNLHNQHHRTSIGTPPEPAAVSLLVPPLDPENTQTDTVAVANRVAATFHDRVREAAGGRVSRYDADFMARAFGEWVQRQGVSVILVEAGGWPESEFAELERIHFAAFTQTLDAIARSALGESGGLEGSDPETYLKLSRSSGYNLYDLMISGTGVAQLMGIGGEATVTTAELGVNFPHRMAGLYDLRDGAIEAIGDLHENGGLDRVDTDGVALPGRIVLAEESPDAFDARRADWDTLTSLGVTTALVAIDFAADDFDEMLQRAHEDEPPLNAALIGNWSGGADDATLLERLHVAYSHGLVGVVGKPPTEAIAAACKRLGLHRLKPDIVPKQSDPVPTDLTAWLRETRTISKALGWEDRGRLKLGFAADFVIAPVADHTIDVEAIEAVYVGGVLVHDREGPTVHAPGIWLPRST